MEEIRCLNCNLLLYKINFEEAVKLIGGTIKCKCTECNEVNIQKLSKDILDYCPTCGKAL